MINEIPIEEVNTAAPGQTVFTFSFRAFEQDALVVIVNGDVATYSPAPVLATEYSITTDYDLEGGEITFGTGLVGGERVIITRDLAQERVTSFPLTGPVSMDNVNIEFDRIVGLIQDLAAELGRTIRVSIGSQGIVIDMSNVEHGDILIYDENVETFITTQLVIGDGVVELRNVATAFVGVLPPEDPRDNDLWWKSDEGRLKIYYNDGDSTQWVDASPAPPGTEQASAAEIFLGAATGKYVSPASFRAATAPVALVDAATIAVDFAAGRNFTVTLAGNRTLGNPANVQAGDSGTIYVIQDATGTRTLGLGANWKPVGGAPTISTDPDVVDVFAYFARSATEITLTYVGAEG